MSSAPYTLQMFDEAGPTHGAAPLVQVLLATYNGERFLREQIDSILAQSYQPLTILARDDGSKDATRAVLAEYASRFPNRFHLLEDGTPTGSPMKNFRKLIQASSAPYIACSDQDDIWLPEKISMSMKALQELEASTGPEKPCLVFTDLKVVGDDLKEISPSFWKAQGIAPKRIFHLHQLLTSNVITGCTLVCNRPLAERAALMPDDAYMHDWWMALLANLFGAARFLAQPTVLYRQHAANVLGLSVGESKVRLPKWRRHGGRRWLWELGERQAAALLRVHGEEITPAAERTLRAFVRCGTDANRLARVGTLMRHGFFYPHLQHTLAILWYLWDMKAAKRYDTAS